MCCTEVNLQRVKKNVFYYLFTGTKISDTVCEDCPPGFYSPEGVDCFKWTE